MNGARALVQTALAGGVEICFANPGTTEMPLVEALDAVRGVRTVLGLFEGVCTGAADGWARMRRRPALTLLHLGPGLANGLANLHNARRAGAPLVNLVGEHASWHLGADPPLASPVAALAAPVSSRVETATSAPDLPGAFARALAHASSPPGRIATLIAPADAQWQEGAEPAAPLTPEPARPVPAERVERAARRLREGTGALLLGGDALGEGGLRAAGRIAAACGATLLCETFPARVERGPGLPRVERLAYFPEQAREELTGLDPLVLVGAREPVAFFGYPDGASRLARPEQLAVLAEPGEDEVAALEALADGLDAPPPAPPRAAPATGGAPGGRLDPAALGATLAAEQPDGAIVVDEGLTSALPWWRAAAGAPPHSVLTLTGGAIGQGLPCATGAALACPDRRVVALQADGAGLYTLQALWTQAREGLDVTTVVCANRAYRILQIEMHRSGMEAPGPAVRGLTELTRPTVDWVALARGFGVPGTVAETAEELRRELRVALAEPGPRLIEARL